MRAKWMVVLVIALTAFGCSQTDEPQIQLIGKKSFSLEVEDFKLTNAKVQDLEEASGGKVVVLQDEYGKAEKTIQLSKGNYQITVFALGTSFDEDAFYLSVGDTYEGRLYPESPGEILPTLDFIHYTQKADGPCKILFTYAEPNVLLDHIEFVP